MESDSNRTEKLEVVNDKIVESPDNSPLIIFNNTQNTTEEVKENDLYIITFHFTQAFMALAIHYTHMIVGPLSIPIMYKIFGSNLCKNMNFSLKPGYIKELIIHVWLIFTLLTFNFFYSESLELMPLYIATGSILILRNLLVSVKYGYFMTCVWADLNERVLEEHELRRFRLNDAWLILDFEQAQCEIIRSFKRLNLVSPDIKLKFSNDFCSGCELGLTSFLRAAEIPHESNKIQVLTFSRYIIEELRKSKSGTKFISAKIMSLLYSLSPLSLRFYKFGADWVLNSTFETVYMICSFFICLYFTHAFLLFIQSGVEDFKRKKLLMAQCSGLISYIDQKHLLIGKDCLPLLDISSPSTIMAWYYMRRCFLDFGQRYTVRVFLYTSLILPMSILVIMIILLQMFNVIGTGYNFYFVPFMILIAQVIIMVVVMAFAAVELNEYFDIHIDILLDHVGKLLRKASRGTGMLEGEEALIDALDFVCAKLEEDKGLRPIKIMGIEMDSVFILKILSIAASGIFAVVQIFYKF